MTARGLGHLLLETHDWGRGVAFWQSLGFTWEYDADHVITIRDPDGRLVRLEASP